VNYAFALLPMARVAVRGRIDVMPAWVLLSAVLFSLIFVFSTVLFLEVLPLFARRLASFFVFMSMFAFVVTRMTPEDTEAFTLAVITMAVVFSAYSILVFARANAAGTLHFEAKDLVGSQRFGFIYVMAWWLLLLARVRTRRLGLIRWGSLIVVLSGIGLTFSRSSVVALLASTALFVAVRAIRRAARLELVLPGPRAWVGIAGLSVAVILLVQMFPLTVEFYGQTLLTPLLDSSLFTAATQAGSSEGIRVVRIMEIVGFVLQYPLTGSGYLGIWAISPSGGGSAHNQLLDTLLRVGFVGFAVYIGILLTVMRHLQRAHTGLFWGMIGVLIYGFFHETFKESHGVFVLAFVVGLTVQHWRSQHTGRLAAAGGL